jgi:hypothetical protein
MKQISFLIAGGKLKPTSLFGAIEVFEKANQFLQDKGDLPYYEIQLVGDESGQKMLNSYFSFHSLKNTNEVEKQIALLYPHLSRRKMQQKNMLLLWAGWKNNTKTVLK